MTSKEFRDEIQKVMPGYKWTVHKESPYTGLRATGIQSSGFNRLSTLEVQREEEHGAAWYIVRSSGYGAKSPWVGVKGNVTLRSALRDLQKHYIHEALKYNSLERALQNGREKKDGGGI